MMLDRKKETLRHFFINMESLRNGDVIMQDHTED
jgi:hypothetical protein